MVRRKDNKGRVLNNGESQRKDGKYVYQYTDATRKRKCVYAWRLSTSDSTPPGKRKDLSLREKEKQIQKDIDDGIIPDGGNLTLLELVKNYVSQKKGVTYKTKRNYNYTINVLANDYFGAKRIDKIKISDAKEWIIGLQDSGKGYGTIQIMHSIVKPAFQMAVNEDMIRKNPFSFPLSTVITNDSKKREAITKEQEREFLNFIWNSKCYSKYYDAIYILFHTGMRISEFCGLTLSDVDLKNRKINIDHQLQRTNNMIYYVTKTKTNAGTRQIPITDEVCECFQHIIKDRRNTIAEPMIDGYTGFLFINKNGNPMISRHWEKIFENIIRKYNKVHDIQMPKITPHICRHTFCSNMAKSGMNPKTLQYLMGHSDINITLNVYTHIGFEDVKAEVLSIQKFGSINCITVES